MQQVLRTKGRGDRVYTVFQLPDHQGSKSSAGAYRKLLEETECQQSPPLYSTHIRPMSNR